MSQIIVQKLNGLQVICPLLKSNKVNLQRSTVALVGNLTKNPNLHNALGKQQVQDKTHGLSLFEKKCVTCLFKLHVRFASLALKSIILNNHLQFYKCLLVLNSQRVLLFRLVAEARKALPELLGILSAGTKEGRESDDTLAMACQSANCLLMKEPEMSKRLLNNNLINSLKDLSQNG